MPEFNTNVIVSMKSFGNTIKLLLLERGKTAKEFAGRVNLSETSLSLIVKGVTKPRQANLTRIIEALCETPEEQQQLITAYARIQDVVGDEEPQIDQDVYDQVEERRVRRYLEAKSQSIAFRESVALLLAESGVEFQGPHQNQGIICDFFISGSPRIAIECKSNPIRGWDRTITSARLLREEMPCDQVIIVVPVIEAISNADQKRVKAADVKLVSIDNLQRGFAKIGTEEPIPPYISRSTIDVDYTKGAIKTEDDLSDYLDAIRIAYMIELKKKRKITL